MQTSNLKEKYLEKIRNELKGSLNKKNIYEVPALEKIVLNIGFGKSSPDQKGRENIAAELEKISGQKSLFTKARKAIAGFKIREGQVIGVKVTLRGQKMYDFFLKLVSIVLPRLRDFRGVPDTYFDGQGNYTLGFREFSVFPEVEYTKSEKSVGLEITVVTSTRNDEEAKELLVKLGMPFKKEAK